MFLYILYLNNCHVLKVINNHDTYIEKYKDRTIRTFIDFCSHWTTECREKYFYQKLRVQGRKKFNGLYKLKTKKSRLE